MLILLLAAGAIANVAVVVMISAFTSRGSWAKVVYRTLDVGAGDAVVLQRAAPRDQSNRAYKQYEAIGVGWRSRMGNSSDQPLAGDDGRFVYLRVFDVGWPWMAMQGEWRSGDSNILPQGFHNAWGRSRIVTSGPDKGLDNDMLPLRPVWPGFALNTMLYAMVLWLLSVAPLALRRRGRIKRGLCPKCAYPVGTSDTCTECGSPVSSPP